MIKPLSVGDVVSAGLRIYRDNFNKYFKLALIGYVWVFVPVYGWAKFSAMMGVISRLAFKEVSEEPESVRDAQRYVNPRKWYFFATGLLVSLIISGAFIPYLLVFGMVLAIIGTLFSEGSFGVVGIILMTILGIAAILVFIFGLIWLISKLFLVELPLAIEENANAASTIIRSWQLTKGSVGRIQLIVFLVFLICVPISVVSNIVGIILQIAIGAAIENAPGLALLGGMFYLAFIFACAALLLPIWQSVKAVIYYDLRMRREGMGINLRK